MSNYDTVQVERKGSVAIVSLNRPDSLNAFNAGFARRPAPGRARSE